MSQCVVSYGLKTVSFFCMRQQDVIYLSLVSLEDMFNKLVGLSETLWRKRYSWMDSFFDKNRRYVSEQGFLLILLSLPDAHFSIEWFLEYALPFLRRQLIVETHIRLVKEYKQVIKVTLENLKMFNMQYQADHRTVTPVLNFDIINDNDLIPMALKEQLSTILEQAPPPVMSEFDLSSLIPRQRSYENNQEEKQVNCESNQEARQGSYDSNQEAKQESNVSSQGENQETKQGSNEGENQETKQGSNEGENQGENQSEQPQVKIEPEDEDIDVKSDILDNGLPVDAWDNESQSSWIQRVLHRSNDSSENFQRNDSNFRSNDSTKVENFRSNDSTKVENFRSNEFTTLEKFRSSSKKFRSNDTLENFSSNDTLENFRSNDSNMIENNCMEINIITATTPPPANVPRYERVHNKKMLSDLYQKTALQALATHQAPESVREASLCLIRAKKCPYIVVKIYRTDPKAYTFKVIHCKRVSVNLAIRTLLRNYPSAVELFATRMKPEEGDIVRILNNQLLSHNIQFTCLRQVFTFSSEKDWQLAMKLIKRIVESRHFY